MKPLFGKTKNLIQFDDPMTSITILDNLIKIEMSSKVVVKIYLQQEHDWRLK